MDHAWLMMRSHAHGETRVHSGESAVGVGGGDNRGDKDACWHIIAGTKGSKGKGVGRLRKAQRTPPPPHCPRCNHCAQVADWLLQQLAQP